MGRAASPFIVDDAVTIIDNPPEDARIVQEEQFGPVLPLLRVDSVDEAVDRANASDYGLGGSVWSSDPDKALEVGARLQTGTVWINAYRVVGPDVPFGGFGQSGLGRENGIEAVHEYTQTKAIWVELSGGTRDPFTLG